MTKVKDVNFFKILISTLFPNVCAGCKAIIDEGEYFCDYCFEMLECCNSDKICRKCGLPKKNCDCGKYVFHFDGFAAPFFNSGPAKKAMYELKFMHKEQYAVFFAEQMALMIRQCFSDNEFDYITYVPMSKFKQLRRGCNQSLILAKELADILNIPLGRDFLKCNSKKKTQHFLSKADRFQNIKGKYICDLSLQGKRILLVDDIKTTGATLDECSKELFISGADSVYCVSGLVTKNRKKKG